MDIVDCVNIDGMKKSDFKQLLEIFLYIEEDGVRWDREDYWNARQERLRNWLYTINNILEGSCKIKE